MNDKIRKISCNEQLYLDMQDLMNTFAIQFIMEYEGNVDKLKLKQAIQYVLKNTNDSNLKLVNEYWYRCTQDIEIEDIIIENENMYEDDFFKEKIDYKKHSLEVFLLNHLEKKYIVFKILHSVSDGKGALLLVENIFKRLKNEEITKCSNDYNEMDLVENLAIYNKNIKLKPCYQYKENINTVKNYIPGWNVISISGYHSGIISKIAQVISTHFKNESVNFMIPVDVRRHLKNENFLGNMTLPIFLNLSLNDSWEDINGKLLYSLKNKEELNRKSLKYFGYQKLPYKIRNFILKIIMKYLNNCRVYTIGSIISYLGRINVETFSNNTFKIVDFISLPLQQPSAPFSIVVVEVNNKTNIAISRYKEQIGDTEFKNVLKEIYDKLKYEIYEKVNHKKQEIVEDCLENILSQIDKNKKIQAIDDYTYSDLNNMVNKIMEIVYKNGIKKNDTVILYMSRSYEFVCSILACMKMNITFIPVDISTNFNRLNDIITDSKSKMLLFNNKEVDTNILKVKIDKKICNEKVVETIKKVTHKKEDIAYKIYTSGTTGKPKGIEISYNNLSNYLMWAKKMYKLEDRFVMPLFTSLSVDLTLTSIFLPLITGGKIKIFARQFSYDILDNIINNTEINIIKATPTHLSLLDKKVKSNIKEIIVGGENFSSKLAENITNYFEENSITIYNEYGPTETTIGCVCCKFEKDNFINVPIGKCINNTKCYLIDKENNIIISENTEGELVIAGYGVSQGLINNSDKSIIKINDELFYKTGDVCFVKDNMLHCIRQN